MGKGRNLSCVMRNENEALAIFMELGQTLGKSPRRGVVEAGIGLIEQEKFGVVNPCSRQGKSLSHASRKCAGTSATYRHESLRFQERVRSLGRILKAVKSAGEDEVLAGREFGIQHCLVSEIAYAGSGGTGLSPIDSSRGRTRQTGKDAEQRALARAVLAKDCEDLSAFEIEVDAVQGGHSAEAFFEPLGLKHGHTAEEAPSSGMGVPQFEQKRQPASSRVPHWVQKVPAAGVDGVEAVVDGWPCWSRS